MRTIKSIRVLLTTVFLLLASACGNSSGNQADKDMELPETKEPVELIFYSNNGASEKVFNENYGNELRKAFPDYTIKYIQSVKGTTLPEMVAAGTRIDIYWDSIGNYESRLMENGLHYDMNELIVKHGVKLNELEPTVIEAMKQISGGKMYGIPVLTSNLNLFYNQSLFDKFGVDYPKDGLTWDEAIALAGKMTRFDGGKQYYGLSVSVDHMIRMNPLSVPNADISKAKPTIDSDDRWKRLYDTVFIRPAADSGYREGIRTLKSLPSLDQFAKEQNLAMLVYLNTLPISLAEQLKAMKWDILPIPVFSDRPGIGTQSYPVYFGLTNQTKHKDAAMEVLKYMVSEPYQQVLAGKGLIPIRMTDSVKSQLGQDTGFKDKNYSAFLQYQFAPITPKAPNYDSVVVRAYRDIVMPLSLGDIDINSAFRTAAESAGRSIAESLAK